ncbi:Ig-like domain-containing protein [Wenzhouxiangella sediminis]|nr:Ig-like domain-containing protein [Wenzhouxiangella sediminis]
MHTSGKKRTVAALMIRKSAMHAVAAIALATGVSSLAQAGQRVASNVSFVVDGGAEIAVLPVIAETAQSDLVTYDLVAGQVQLSAGNLSPDYVDPLFCFDMGSQPVDATIRVKDPNGHEIIDNFYLISSLEYSLSAAPSLSIRPATNQQCFFRSSGGTFGLFGMESQEGAGDTDVIARDRFEINRSLDLEFQRVPTFVTPDQTFDYDIVVTNTGTGALNNVALQELFPENLDVYSAALTPATWTCTATGDAVCPTVSANASSLRFEQMNAGGIDLPAGDSLTFTIERTVATNSATGEDIHLHAGTVADPLSTGTPFAVGEATMTVIGESDGLSVSATDATADSAITTGNTGDDAQITVTVLDASLNPVPNEPVAVDNAGGLTITSPSSGTTDINGEVSFTAAPPATLSNAGDYTISFTSGNLSGNGVVTILPGEPASFFMQASVPTATADGQDPVEIQALVEDQFENPVDAAEVEVAQDDGLASLPASAFTDINGIAVFNATSTSTGTFEPSFSVAGVGTSPATVSFEAGAPDDLVFTLQPPNPVVAGTSFDVSLNVVDAEENLVTDDQLTFVTLNLQQGGSTVRTLTSGLVTNGQITLTVGSIDSNDIGTDYRIQAVASGTGFFGANSTTFEVVAPQ